MIGAIGELRTGAAKPATDERRDDLRPIEAHRCGVGTEIRPVFIAHADGVNGVLPGCWSSRSSLAVGHGFASLIASWGDRSRFSYGQKPCAATSHVVYLCLYGNSVLAGEIQMVCTVSHPFVATVHRPGLPEVHLGLAFQHQAEHASWSLTSDLTNTQHIEGTTITWSRTPDGVSALAPVPADPCALAGLIAQEDNNLPTGHAFPDLFSRLKAQEGYETAARIWRDACLWLDADFTDE